jgi:hypothetical protein
MRSLGSEQSAFLTLFVARPLSLTRDGQGMLRIQMMLNMMHIDIISG